MALWLDSGSRQIGPKSAAIAEEAWQLGQLAISAFSFWEVAMLVGKRRLRLRESAVDWRSIMLELGYREVPLNGDVAASAVTLPDLHPDPADRFLVATALSIDATLLTADRKLLAWAGPLRRLDASR